MLKDRLPSWRDTFLIFAAVAFPIHVWAIIGALREVPAWILRLSIWDVVGVMSYTLVIALLETLLVTVAIVLLTMLLPEQWRKKKRVGIASIIVFVASIWFVILHYNSTLIDNRQVVGLAVWAVSMLALIGGSIWLMLRNQRVERLLRGLIQQLAVLSVAYLLIDIFSIILIVIRNA